MKTGAERLAEADFEPLKGFRVGLIVNQTSRIGDMHLVDALISAGVDVVALFGPEHGIRGTSGAGEAIDDGRDTHTGLPVYSLYGSRLAPPKEVLGRLDLLVFDIQDIGVRAYTYISTMGHAMRAAASEGVRYMVLDRPNPLGGEYVSGFVMEEDLQSFVGRYPIPLVHGLTVGELSGMIKGEAWFTGLENLDLNVSRLEGWQRGVLWPELGREWIAPSPAVSDFETALVYAGAVLIEGTEASEGRGTTMPFRIFGAPFLNGRELAVELERRGLQGVSFDHEDFRPDRVLSGVPDPKYEGMTLQGLSISVTNPPKFEPVETFIHVLHAMSLQAGASTLIAKRKWMSQLAGTDTLFLMLEEGAAPGDIISRWSDEVSAFREQRKRYLQY